MSSDWWDGDLVFDRGDGRHFSPTTVRDAFDRAIKAVGVPRIPFHDCRHAIATLAMANDVHPKIVQELLGHSTVLITLNRSSHVGLHLQREAANRLEAELGGARDQDVTKERLGA